MGYIVRMPQLGMSMEEGIVVEWLVDEGETVEEGDNVVLVESEKTTNEVVARENGVLKRVLASEDVLLEPGDPIAILAGADENVSQYLDQIDDSALDEREVTGGHESADETSDNARPEGIQVGIWNGEPRSPPRTSVPHREHGEPLRARTSTWLT